MLFEKGAQVRVRPLDRIGYVVADDGTTAQIRWKQDAASEVLTVLSNELEAVTNEMEPSDIVDD
jgi:hypothetical protein